MAWEKRKTYDYYYRSVRKPDGRVVKQYFGNGAAAETEARLVRQRAEQRRRDERAILDLYVQVHPADQLLETLNYECRRLLHGSLLAAGYHKHHSEWRKKGCHGRPRSPNKTE